MSISDALKILENHWKAGKRLHLLRFLNVRQKIYSVNTSQTIEEVSHIEIWPKRHRMTVEDLFFNRFLNCFKKCSLQKTGEEKNLYTKLAQLGRSIIMWVSVYFFESQFSKTKAYLKDKNGSKGPAFL